MELGGSLGRGEGDELSDIDAGIGVDLGAIDYPAARDAALAAARAFAAVSDTLIQALGSPAAPRDHLIVQYADGRQLSLVVADAASRPGLPPGSRALLDRDGTLAHPWLPSVHAADGDARREWAFLAWIALGDLARHLIRGRCWRALETLHEARSQTWKLIADARGVDYPAYGAVSVENADLAPPPELARTLPDGPSPAAILTAAGELAAVLEPLGASLAVDGVREAGRARLVLAARRLRPTGSDGP